MQLHRRQRVKDPNVPSNAPLATLALAAMLLGTGVLIVLFGGDTDAAHQLLAVVIAALPALLAAGYAERTSRDVRNGTVVEKARQGARKALEDHHVLQESSPAVQGALAGQQASMEALARLLNSAAADGGTVTLTTERTGDSHGQDKS